MRRLSHRSRRAGIRNPNRQWPFRSNRQVRALGDIRTGYLCHCQDRLCLACRCACVKADATCLNYAATEPRAARFRLTRKIEWAPDFLSVPESVRPTAPILGSTEMAFTGVANSPAFQK
jgi:hypothetical protein